MKLRDIHILGISGIVVVSGVVGYLLGRKHGYELAEKDIFDEEQEEKKEELYVEKTSFHGKPGYKVSLKNSSGVLWEPSPFDICDVEHKENTETELSWWQEYVLDDYHKKLKDYYAKEEENDEDEIENIRTQSEVEYTSEEPYLVKESDVFSIEADVNDIVQLTYYEADDVLVDSQGEILEERTLVGCEEFKKNFGYGSNDPNVVYVRNPINKRDYEIVRDPGSYEQEVLGATEAQVRNAVKYFKFGEEE